MLYVDSNSSIYTFPPESGEYFEVVNPQFQYYKLRKDWKECIPDVWEFNPFKVSTQLNFLVDTVIGDKLAKAYNTYINELIAFKLEAQKDIDSIKSEEDVERVTNKIKRIADNISLGPIDPTIFK